MSEYSSSQESLIDSFIAITGVDKERAAFFLQSAAWNLDAAVGTFYDNSETSEQSTGTLATNATRNSSESQLEPSPPSPSSSIEPLQKQPGRSTGVATLSDYREKQTAPSDDDAQKFFAGGSERSGQMIEGPPRKKQTPDSIAKDVFEAAKKHGAVSVEEEERERKREASAAFQGAGFRLGAEEGPSQMIGRQVPVPVRPEMVRHVLTFWKDGFSVDDGPLRTGDSEEDRSFIASVRKGEIPQELMNAAKGGEVDVDIRDKREEAYVKPKPKVIAFSGEGRKLGSFAPEVISSSGSGGASAAVTTPPVTTPPPSVPLDPDQPTTSIQIRLADGSRLVSKFNHTHTVNDIRHFINMSSPSPANYVLMTTFPNKELSDPTLTLSQANLLNAVIMQRIR